MLLWTLHDLELARCIITIYFYLHIFKYISTIHGINHVYIMLRFKTSAIGGLESNIFILEESFSHDFWKNLQDKRNF